MILGNTKLLSISLAIAGAGAALVSPAVSATGCSSTLSLPGGGVEQVSTVPAGTPANVAIYKRQANGSYVRTAAFNLNYGPRGIALPAGSAGGGGGPGGGQQNSIGGAVGALACDDEEGDGTPDNPYRLPHTFVTASTTASHAYLGAGDVSATPLPTTNEAACRTALLSLEMLGCDADDGVGPRTTNGCGSSSVDVPDGFIGAPAAGNIFTAACNAHDICYGTLNQGKNYCDLRLGNAMRTACDVHFNVNNPGWGSAVTPEERHAIHSACNAQAQAYETGLIGTIQAWAAANMPGAWSWAASQMPTASNLAYEAAQHQDACRDARAKKAQYCGR